MRRDADGYFYFVTRKKDIIRRRGENIAGLEKHVLTADPTLRSRAIDLQAKNTIDYNVMSDDDFRREVRVFFEAEYPRELRYILRRARWREMKGWWRKLYEKGWVAPNWPREWGGMGLDAGKMLIYVEELERHGIARAPDQGITHIGPILMKFGTEAQKQHYLPRSLSGEYIWCQGYSEPNAGSDLASLQTSAVLEGDEFVINGQKIWTSLADDATHIYVLVRSDKHAAKKQQGISLLLAETQTPGITIRPIRNIAGHEEFCQVFFDDVRVPRDNLVGKLNEGWNVAKALLSFERLSIGSPRRPECLGRRGGAFRGSVRPARPRAAGVFRCNRRGDTRAAGAHRLHCQSPRCYGQYQHRRRQRLSRSDSQRARGSEHRPGDRTRTAQPRGDRVG